MKRRILEVSTPGRAVLRVDLPDERELTAGGHPDAHIPLDFLGAPPQVLVLGIAETGVLVRTANDAAPSFIYSGQATREAVVPWGDEVYCGAARFTFIEEAVRSQAITALFALAALALIATGALVAAVDGAGNDSASEPDPPALFQAAACPDTDATLARRRADEARESARAMAARAVFDRRDGRRALELLDQARACLQVAQDAPALAKATAELASWGQHMNEELSTLRLRLRLARDQGKAEDALAAVRALEALVPESPPSAYREYLRELHRDLDRQLARKGE